MKKIITASAVFVCMAAFLPTAYAGDSFQPTLRVGTAFDAEHSDYHLSRSTTFLGFSDLDLELGNVARPYIALELPFSVTDRFKLSLNGDWSFTSSDSWDVSSRYENLTGVALVDRDYETDDTARWGSAELLASYAFSKTDTSEVSFVAGVRWDYSDLNFDNPQGLLTVPTDWLHFKQESLAPVIGLSGRFQGPKSGIWGGDIHLSVLAGPILWGDVRYEETINGVNDLVYDGDLSSGYVVKLYGDMAILSGKLSPTSEGSLSVFVQFTKTDVHGDGDMKDLSQPLVAPRDFDYDGGGTVGVIGLSGKLSF